MTEPRVVTVTLNPAIDWTVTVPGFTAGEVNRVRAEQRRAAGKGVNVAAALAAYGIPVAATGFLGHGNAAIFEAFFTERGIADHFVRIPGETRTGVKVVDPATRETTDINFPGLSPSPAELDALRERIAALAGRGSPWVVLAGSLPPGVPPTFYRDLVDHLHAAGCRVVVDASGEVLREALDAGPDVVKPNAHELSTLAGRPLSSQAEVLEAAGALLENVALAAISMGAAGSVFLEDGRGVTAHPPPIRVHSTVGAGDAMVAGIVAARLAGLDLAETARLATAFSVHALSGPDQPDSRDAVRAAGARVEVREV